MYASFPFLSMTHNGYDYFGCVAHDVGECDLSCVYRLDPMLSRVHISAARKSSRLRFMMRS